MQRDPLVEEWCAIARQDLGSAQYLKTMRPMPLEVIGFLCQQAVEKYLKAYLVFHRIDPDKTHDLLFLLKQCQEFDPTFLELFETASTLNKYAVQTRYPYPFQLNEAQILRSLAAATAASAFVAGRLPWNDDDPDA